MHLHDRHDKNDKHDMTVCTSLMKAYCSRTKSKSPHGRISLQQVVMHSPKCWHLLGLVLLGLKWKSGVITLLKMYFRGNHLVFNGTKKVQNKPELQDHGRV